MNSVVFDQFLNDFSPASSDVFKKWMRTMAKGSGVRDRIRNLFLSRLGEVITRQEIVDASRDPKTGEEPENWHQRLSELRTDEGYTIWAARDSDRLKPGQYMMPYAERREIAGLAGLVWTASGYEEELLG